ncbi:phosphate uptake regulator PhoU [Candidatus Woesearchaeota archaeon]|nr:phosphate uptake regulator PhoU [Candidatus Woesearchaeota archaeon]
MQEAFANVMQRKLIQLSPSTVVVSLPSSWIKENHLKKGAELSVDARDNTVVITPIRTEPREATVDISKLEGRLVWTSISAAYVAGYDSIMLHTRDQKQAAELTKVVRHFPGMIIYDERKNLVQFKELAAESKVDVQKMVNRVFHLTASMIDDAVDASKKKDWALLREVKQRDFPINSYAEYAMRHVNKYGTANKAAFYGYVVCLEMLADKLCVLFASLGAERRAHDASVLSELAQLYRELESLHWTYSQEKLVSLETHRQRLLGHARHPRLMQVLEAFFALEELEMQLHA